MSIQTTDCMNCSILTLLNKGYIYNPGNCHSRGHVTFKIILSPLKLEFMDRLSTLLAHYKYHYPKDCLHSTWVHVGLLTGKICMSDDISI